MRALTEWEADEEDAEHFDAGTLFAFFSRETPFPYAGVVFYEGAWRVWPPTGFYYSDSRYEPIKKSKHIDEVLTETGMWAEYPTREAAMLACRLMFSDE